ncbi:MAG: flagellar basal body protein FliL, partial [Sphingopyxis macrogoltabida]
MSDEAPSPKKKKGGKMKTLLLVLIGGIVLIGGGIGAGIYAAGAGLVGGHPGEVEDPNKPKLVLKDGVEEPGNHKPSKDGTDHADPAL